MQHKRTITQRIATGVLAVAMLLSTLAPTFGPVVYADDVSSIVTDGGGISTGTPEATSAPESSAIPEPSAAPEASAAPTTTPETSATPEETLAPTAKPEESAAPEESEKPESSATPEESAVPEGSPTPESSAPPEPSPTPTATPETSATPEPLELIAPESDLLEASVGDELTLTVELNREDVEVAYQWQKMYTGKPEAFDTALADYAEDEPTWYSWPLEDKSEAEALAENPDATWQGMELYFAIVAALDEIEADSSNVRIAWKTPNYALDGFVITAETSEDGIVLYADKDEERHIGTLQDGEWTFGDAVEASQPEQATWQDIDGATASTYDLTVTEEDYDTSYRCVVTILDEDYKESCAKLLEEQGITLTEEEKAEEQVLYSATMKIAAPVMDEVDFRIAPLAASAAGDPKLSSDAQWITGLTNGYEYITKDTYDRVTGWLNEGKISQTQADVYWTRLGSEGFGSSNYTNVLDEDGFPTGQVRSYSGFDLTDGDKLEVLSEWYGKTVYFRPVENGQKWTSTGTAIDIPAYTNLTIDDDGHYVESASGTKYKKAITMLNAFVPDTGSIYKYYLKAVTSDGWLHNSSDDSTHIQVYAVNCESFNRDPARYLVDAEGNYRMDSFAWGVCTDQEPDISGKAYWELKNYIAQGYGMMVGHDTLYAYAGAYYDAFGTDLDESSIDPADTTTRYYALNSWVPNTGHWYMNELMGANGGNVNSGSVLASDAPSLILSTGGSHGQYGKNIQYGTEELHILQTGWDAATAAANVKYRTPTNFPYSFSVGQTFSAAWTHTNQQAAFGTIWVDYSGTNKGAAEYGYFENPYTWTIGGKTGTNNFYLSGISNFLMNQIGHLPTNSATAGESRLFANSVMYISQRKQCEICAANQGGQENSHFVRRISSANAGEVLTALQNGGSYWYPLDGCYMLVEDITLPANWTPIKNFTGHWNADVYKVDLNGAASVFDTSGSDWNLGTDKSKGVETVFDKDMKRTTGVARVVGDLNDLFGTSTSYAGYTVKVLGSDNPKYMKSGEQYTCSVNSDNKYVISNLPCVYDGTNGVLTARVYDINGNEVTKYGKIVVRVSTAYWETTETIPLELLDFSALGPGDQTIWVGQSASFVATVLTDQPEYCSDPSNIQWQYKTPRGQWINVGTGLEYEVNHRGYVDTGDVTTSGVQSELIVKNAPLSLDGTLFRICYKTPKGERETTSGKLAVKKPEIKIGITGDQTVWVRPKASNNRDITDALPADQWPGTYGIKYPANLGSQNNGKNQAVYTSTVDFLPALDSRSVPIIQWVYRPDNQTSEATLATSQWNGSSWQTTIDQGALTAIRKHAPNLSIDIRLSNPKATENGWQQITSTMTITNANTKMDIGNTRYFFRAIAQNSYGQGASAYEGKVTSADAALIVDYTISLDPKDGVSTGGLPATWRFPNLEISAPNGLRTVVLSFYQPGHNTGNTIQISGWPHGITGYFVSNDYVIFRTGNGNLLGKEYWEDFLRNYISFKTYDGKDADPKDISWYISEEDNADSFKLRLYDGSANGWTYSGSNWMPRDEYNGTPSTSDWSDGMSGYNESNRYPGLSGGSTLTGTVISGTQYRGRYYAGSISGDYYHFHGFNATLSRGFDATAYNKLYLRADIQSSHPTGSIKGSITLGGMELVPEKSSKDGISYAGIVDIAALTGWQELRLNTNSVTAYILQKSDGGSINTDHINRTDTITLNVYEAWLTSRDFQRTNRSDIQYSELDINKNVTENKPEITVLLTPDPEKVYDGTPSKAVFTVLGGDPAWVLSHATIRYTNASGIELSRGPVDVDSGCIDASTYTARVELDAAVFDRYTVHGLNDGTGVRTIFKITPRPLTVHSLYLEDATRPRNIKAYDATTNATIGDILIDNIVAGDSVWVDKKTYAGIYATANASERLDENGHTMPNRFLKLAENAITRTEPIRLVNDPNGNYYIAQEIYSGAIYRASLTAQVGSSRTMYGQPVDYGEAGKPWHDTVPYKANTAATEGCWLKLDGLKGADTLTADYGKSNFSILGAPDLIVDETTPVGMYKLTYTGLTEANYPVLSNYIVAVLDGTQEVYAREIRLTVEDSDRYVEDESLPETHVTFDLLADDGETYAALGSNVDVLYKDMPLKNGDTVQSVVLVKEKGSESTVSLADSTGSKLVAEIEENGTKKTQYTNDSIPLVSDWFMGCPAKYLDLEHDQSIYPCDWCEQYHGFELGTDHWKVTGYAVAVNQDASQNSTLTVATVENPLGEQVQNYSLRYVAGSITVHPELRFQLKATVPLYVCMYGYAGDGEVVEPTNYGITNYSNGKIQITDIDVSNNGWSIVDKPQSELKRGELSMKLDDTQLVMGHNTPRTPWIIDPGRDADGNESGTVLPLPLLCNMAGGNVNDRQEAFLTRVTYTIAEYGITIPGETDVEIGDVIDGQPTTPVIGQK